MGAGVRNQIQFPLFESFFQEGSNVPPQQIQVQSPSRRWLSSPWLSPFLGQPSDDWRCECPPRLLIILSAGLFFFLLQHCCQHCQQSEQQQQQPEWQQPQFCQPAEQQPQHEPEHHQPVEHWPPTTSPREEKKIRQTIQISSHKHNKYENVWYIS